MDAGLRVDWGCHWLLSSRSTPAGGDSRAPRSPATLCLCYPLFVSPLPRHHAAPCPCAPPLLSYSSFHAIPPQPLPDCFVLFGGVFVRCSKHLPALHATPCAACALSSGSCRQACHSLPSLQAARFFCLCLRCIILPQRPASRLVDPSMPPLGHGSRFVQAHTCAPLGLRPSPLILWLVRLPTAITTVHTVVLVLS